MSKSGRTSTILFFLLYNFRGKLPQHTASSVIQSGLRDADCWWKWSKWALSPWATGELYLISRGEAWPLSCRDAIWFMARPTVMLAQPTPHFSSGEQLQGNVPHTHSKGGEKTVQYMAFWSGPHVHTEAFRMRSYSCTTAYGDPSVTHFRQSKKWKTILPCLRSSPQLCWSTHIHYNWAPPHLCQVLIIKRNEWGIGKSEGPGCTIAH